MKSSGRKKLLFTAIILLSALLLNHEYDITNYPVLPYAVLGLIKMEFVYVAIFACLLVVTKEYRSKANALKAFGVVALFAAVDLCLDKLSDFSLTVASIYQIIRPVAAAACILLAAKLITKTKPRFSVKITIAGGVAFLLHVAVTVWCYISLAGVTEVVVLIFFSAVYSFIINIFTYVIVFIAFCAVTSQISGEKAVTGGQSDAENV